jgi:hypothetical protein
MISLSREPLASVNARARLAANQIVATARRITRWRSDLERECPMPPAIPSKPRRPTALTVIAILNLILGGLGILFSACGFAFMGTPLGESVVEWGRSQPGQVKGADWGSIQEEISERAPYYNEVIWGGMIGDSIASILLIVTGIGLLRVQNWARNLAIVYGTLQLLHTLLYATYTLAIVTPVMNELRAEALAKAPLGFQGSMADIGLLSGIAGTVVGAVLSPIYPMIVLSVMFFPSVRRVFKDRAVASPVSSPTGD